MHKTARWTARDVATLVTTPLIYSLLLPFEVLDLWATLFQWSCFPIYRMAPVRRAPYFVADRYKLPYLTWWQKVNCAYCGYANGVLAYVTEVAARTEQYWCPIKHARAPRATHVRYRGFLPYGDAQAFRRGLNGLRRDLVRARTTRRYHPWPSVKRTARAS